MDDYTVLYVFVRTDMPSMNSGKAQAHSGHAANAFVHENVISKLINKQPLGKLIEDWTNCTPQGFGTQINLQGAWKDVLEALNIAKSQGLIANMVNDPTYPYVVNSEVVGLIDPTVHTMIPADLGNGMFLCHRSEMTAVYIFGLKQNLEPIVGKFPLAP
jgi:Peptidyl-tRNA hydrolase PTH2